MHHIDRLKEPSHMILSVDAEQVFEKTQYNFMIKTLNNLGIEVNFLNLIKSIYENSTSNIRLNGERLKAFSLRSETRQGCLLSPILFNTVLKVLARTIGKEKEKKALRLDRKK